jgi:HAD superfamily hydrolase (TIGR01549 family)
MLISKKKIILLDLDGVLINSLKNMRTSWNNTRKKFNIKHTFNDYEKLIGLPFYSILRKFNLNSEDYSKIKKNYDSISNKKLALIKIYPNVKDTLNYLIKKKYTIGLITSKDKKRTKKVISKFKLKFKYVYSPTNQIKPKPYPDQILKIVKLEKIKKKDCIYIGDMSLDKKFAKNAGIKFIHAAYGYEKKKINTKFKIKKFRDLKRLLEHVF